MRKYLKSFILASAFLIPGGGYARTILTSRATADYENRLQKQPEIADLLKIPDSLTSQEADALKFLYAYISTPDALDYTPEFYLENIRLALKAREEMPWGKVVPDREWRHFVLPVRVNNENLDRSRSIFYDELKDRVGNLSMKDAILEVNHWCHEKVSYQPSDARTSSPLVTMGNALGRCGEESTFTVAALRSIGIPARQVYTPRWAHTDDNHAWVEAWADGKWYFLGACEPEPVLDLAWFNAPASRGMLMSTNITGSYDGPEEKLASTPITTVINVTENYAPVVKSGIVVKDRAGKPVKDATVRFCLYNYAEFFPLAVKKTDACGHTDFISGLGDMVVWASDGKNFNFTKLHAGDTPELILDKDASFTGGFDFDLVPPPSGGMMPEVSPDAIIANDRRKAYEDSIRLAYVNTFITPEKGLDICKSLDMDSIAAPILVNSRGNHKVILEFLSSLPVSQRKRALSLLGNVAEKDLHDMTTDVLTDHLLYSNGDESSPLFAHYVLNPRIEIEMIHPYKEIIRKNLSDDQISRYKMDPRQLEEDLKNKIVIDMDFNPGRFRQSPVATLDHGIADRLNRSILFVAICRSIGVPARIDQVSRITQYADEKGEWHDVNFEEADPEIQLEEKKGILEIVNGSGDLGREPKYYSHFTISRIADGVPELMEFDDFETLESINSRCQPLQEGQYMMVTGQRLANGTVLAHTEFFNAKAGEKAMPKLVVRQDSTALQVIGNLDAELLYSPFTPGAGNSSDSDPRSILSTTGRGYYGLGIILPGHEPSAHALNDIAAAAVELEKTGSKILILFPDAESASRFSPGDFGTLPDNVVFGIDNGSIMEALKNGLEMPPVASTDMPIFVVADSFNRIVAMRKGYTIHLGEELARILNSVE
ncbi:MAG: transglutaminase-like domain-containing protein [Muribaculaceae bacterium]|nr:transglutaminase-like domain-containing protein [Muribaculaceae bacterium]